MKVELSEDAIWHLQNLASDSTCYELDTEFTPMEHHKMDCFRLGEEDGMIILARDILRKMGIEYTADLP